MTAPQESGHPAQIGDATAHRNDGSREPQTPGALTESAKHDDKAPGDALAKTTKMETKMNAQVEIKPGGVFSALASAKADVKRIAKENRNTEQKYDFASVDDFFAMLGPICAKHGLVTIIDEDSTEFLEKQGKYGPSHWVRICYQITTYHASGDSTPTVRRHIEVLRTGPQAYGSAQSYILKQYYRGILEIPTGDGDDPDFGVTDAQRDTAAAPKQGQEAVTKAIEYLSEADSLEALQTRWGNIPGDVKSDKRVIAAKDAAKERLSKPAADLGGDEIQY